MREATQLGVPAADLQVEIVRAIGGGSGKRGGEPQPDHFAILVSLAWNAGFQLLPPSSE